MKGKLYIIPKPSFEEGKQLPDAPVLLGEAVFDFVKTDLGILLPRKVVEDRKPLLGLPKWSVSGEFKKDSESFLTVALRESDRIEADRRRLEGSIFLGVHNGQLEAQQPRKPLPPKVKTEWFDSRVAFPDGTKLVRRTGPKREIKVRKSK